MDTTTLVVVNGILFALYAGVMLVNAKIVGGARGALWFAGSNLLRAIAMVIVGVERLQPLPSPHIGALSAVLSVTGAMMLHQAFAELLEGGAMMRGVQYVLVAIMTTGSAALLIAPQLEYLLGFVLCATLAVQFAVIALLVIRFSGEEVGPAGRLTSAALAVYSATFVLRAYASSSLGERLIDLSPSITKTWLISCLITSAAIAFGFMSLSTARLRVELLWRAQVDELTGLLNRWALKRMAMREIARSRRHGNPLTVVMIDLDGMKLVNDSRGHTCGDVLLQAVAGVLQEAVREQDSVARMGGDEFCILLPDTSLEAALTVAERLRRDIDALEVNYRGAAVRTSASLGVTSSDVCGLSWQSLMDSSDEMLYHAKHLGKNRIVSASESEIGESVQQGAGKLMSERDTALS